MRRFLLPLFLALTLGLAACGGGDDDTAGSGDDTGSGGGSASTVEVLGTDDIKFDSTEVSASAGDITVELTCEEGVPHNFVVEEADDALVAECEGGETGTGTISLDAGTYTFYCSVPGHRSAGMEGTLTVG